MTRQSPDVLVMENEEVDYHSARSQNMHANVKLVRHEQESPWQQLVGKSKRNPEKLSAAKRIRKERLSVEPEQRNGEHAKRDNEK